MTQGDLKQPEGRFLVRAIAPQDVTHFVENVRNEPGVIFLDEIGPPGQPHTLLISMSNEQAEALKQRFAGQFIIEPDQPLQLF
jgi:hypothetical protein